MKRLSPAKRNQLIIVLLITAALIGAVYFLLISPQNDENHKLIKQAEDRQADLDKYKKIISEAQTTSNQLASVSLQLNNAERDIATGDAYAWIYDTLRRFKANYHVDIPTIGQPAISDVDLVPNFPYKQVRISLNGSAYYHDLGKFIADFENNFPHIRLVNLALQSDGDPNGISEQLTFHVDLVALIKPNS
jgi:Tfp pilus assembly protein PilO